MNTAPLTSISTYSGTEAALRSPASRTRPSVMRMNAVDMPQSAHSLLYSAFQRHTGVDERRVFSGTRKGAARRRRR
ncbi:MAG TPA: hypothetical protein VNL69_11310, partial [Bacteroidota bacterium]|nr:hypothetical protein [Bacteroidota bacterium]